MITRPRVCFVLGLVLGIAGSFGVPALKSLLPQQSEIRFTIAENFEPPMVTLRSDGKVEYGPGYEPDKAARTFWEAMSRWSMPCHWAGLAPSDEMLSVR